MNKGFFVVGDEVVIVEAAVDSDGVRVPGSPDVGAVGRIKEVDTEWMYPYVIDIDSQNLYDENMLQLVKTPFDEMMDSINKPDVFKAFGLSEGHDKALLELETLYYTDQNRVAFRVRNGEVFFDDDQKTTHEANVFINGFLDGLNYAGVKFVVTAKYIKG